jgi:alpha-tubulin suppressor-like RCC1 family protein
LGTGDLGNPPGETLEIISSGVEQAFAGPENSFILMEDGRLLACGTGALGYPLTGPENPLDNKSINYPPKQVMRDVVKVVATSQETLFLDQQGVLYKSNLFASIKPQPVLTDVQDIAATDTWFLGLKRDGTAFNQSLIDMPGSVNRIFAGGEQVLTIYADGKADLQGGNAYGQLLKKAGE